MTYESRVMVTHTYLQLSQKQSSLTFIDLGCTYLAQKKSIVCRSQRNKKITMITLESNDNVNYV